MKPTLAFRSIVVTWIPSGSTDVTRTTVFEPVGTHLNHQKQGLSTAAMAEDLCHSDPRRNIGNSKSMGFTEFKPLKPRIKEW